MFASFISAMHHPLLFHPRHRTATKRKEKGKGEASQLPPSRSTPDTAERKNRAPLHDFHQGEEGKETKVSLRTTVSPSTYQKGVRLGSLRAPTAAPKKKRKGGRRGKESGRSWHPRIATVAYLHILLRKNARGGKKKGGGCGSSQWPRTPAYVGEKGEGRTALKSM